MHPCMRVRWRHPHELSLHCVKGMLFHIRQQEESFVGSGESRTMGIGTVAAAGAGLPIPGAVLPIGHHRVLDRRQQRLDCVGGETSHRPYTSGACGDSRVAGYRHRRDAMVRRGISYTLKLDSVYCPTSFSILPRRCAKRSMPRCLCPRIPYTSHVAIPGYLPCNSQHKLCNVYSSNS